MKPGYFLPKIGLIILLSISATPLWGQKTLYGILYLNLTGGNGISDVRVSARGANTNLSLTNGTFELVFPSKKPGDKALITIDKPGMEVVNQEALKPVLPSSDDETLEIILCKQGKRQDFAPLYYQLKINNIVDDKYKKELKEIVSNAADGLDTDAIARITREKEKAEAQAQEMARALAQIDLENASELYQEAFSYFVKGEIDQVMDLLSEDILEAELKKANEMQQKAQTARLQVIQSYMLKARSYLMQFQFQDATNSFEKAIEADSTIYENQMEFGIALWNYGFFNKANQRFQRALILARTEYEKGKTYRYLGNNHLILGNIQQAREASSKALNILKGIKTAQSQREMGYVYKTIGLIQTAEKDFEGAEGSYHLAYAITDSMASEDDIKARALLASILTNQGLLYKRLERYEEAAVVTTKAIQLNRELVARDSSRHLAELGIALNNQGILLFKLGQKTNALTHYEEAIRIFEHLTPQKPIIYREMIAISIINICLIYIENEDHQGAINMLASAEEAAEDLVKHQPSIRHSGILNYIYQNTGYAYEYVHDFDKSLSYYQKALAIRRQLAGINTKAFQRDVAKTLVVMARLCQTQLEKFPTVENQNQLIAYLDSTAEALKTCPETPDVQKNIQVPEKSMRTYATQVKLDDLIKINQAGDDFKAATEVKELRKTGDKWLGLWNKLSKNFPEQTKEPMIKTYEALSKGYLEGGAFGDAQTSALAGIALDSTHQNMNLLLALAYAYIDHMPQAEELIQQWANEPFRGSTWKGIMLKRLIELEEKGHASPYATQIKDLLN